MSRKGSVTLGRVRVIRRWPILESLDVKGSIMNRLALATAFAAAAVTLSACGGTQEAAAPAVDPAPSSQPSTPNSKPASTPKASAKAAEVVTGSYVGFDEYTANPADFKGGDVVLFFNASWCPTCQEAQRNLEASGVPEGLTVVKVDYDSSSDLKQKYGVTIQHTFVQIDKDGNEIAQWNGSSSGAEIASETV